jgi:hypothetical protein
MFLRYATDGSLRKVVQQLHRFSQLATVLSHRRYTDRTFSWSATALIEGLRISRISPMQTSRTKIVFVAFLRGKWRVGVSDPSNRRR